VTDSAFSFIVWPGTPAQIGAACTPVAAIRAYIVTVFTDTAVTADVGAVRAIVAVRTKHNGAFAGSAKPAKAAEICTFRTKPAARANIIAPFTGIAVTAKVGAFAASILAGANRSRSAKTTPAFNNRTADTFAAILAGITFIADYRTISARVSAVSAYKSAVYAYIAVCTLISAIIAKIATPASIRTIRAVIPTPPTDFGAIFAKSAVAAHVSAVRTIISAVVANISAVYTKSATVANNGTKLAAISAVPANHNAATLAAVAAAPA